MGRGRIFSSSYSCTNSFLEISRSLIIFLNRPLPTFLPGWIGIVIIWLFRFFRSSRKTHLLQMIYDEIRSGDYDGDELARRLRKLEEKKVYVQSIIYSLLCLRWQIGTANRWLAVRNWVKQNGRNRRIHRKTFAANCTRVVGVIQITFWASA